MASLSDSHAGGGAAGEDAAFARMLERATRTLPLSSPDEVKAMRELLSKLVGNVAAAPWDPKYRSLRVDNKTLRARLFDRPGAAEAVAVLGFKRQSLPDTGEAAMVLPFDPAEEAELKRTAKAGAAMPVASASTSAAGLLEAWDWLDAQLGACLDMAGHASRAGVGQAGATQPTAAAQRSACAEVVLQLRLLPGGSVLRAAFFATEPLGAVRDFLNAAYPVALFVKGAAAAEAAAAASATWVLQRTHPRLAYDEDELSASLLSLGLTPRAALAAVPFGHKALEDVTHC